MNKASKYSKTSKTIIYPWKYPEYLKNTPTLNLSFRVQNYEEYESQDLPIKSNFQHPWSNWSGVKVFYEFDQEELVIPGSRGKTVWYIPATNPVSASVLKLEVGQALKIVKHNVLNNLNDEIERLKLEQEIQNNLWGRGFAPRAFGIISIINTVSNKVRWFDKIYLHPANSFYLATIVEHIETEKFDEKLVTLNKEFMLEGDLIDELVRTCDELNIRPYDLCLGNILFSKNKIKVVDFHKWQYK